MLTTAAQPNMCFHPSWILLGLLFPGGILNAQASLQQDDARQGRIDLAGAWVCRLDPQDAGDDERWFAAPLEGSPIQLPGTTDLAGLGPWLDRETMQYPVPLVEGKWPGTAGVERADETGHLVRERYFLGRAWYQREFEITPEQAAVRAWLSLERVLWQSRVWLDGVPFGERDSLATPHEYRIGPLAPGRHLLTVCVDNRQIRDIGVYGHSYGPETQSRWNGIVGRIELRPESVIHRIEVHPAADARSVEVEVELRNTDPSGMPRTLPLRLELASSGGEVLGSWEDEVVAAPGRTVLVRTVELAEAAARWDEFSPVLHQLTATLDGGSSRSVRFGFRHIERDGRSIRLNGRRIFLRGTLDCCVFPRTGHPPTSIEEWRRILGVVQEHGFNHVRFHTWCPPEAAFEAADELGLYLQPETAWWVDNWIAATENGPPLPGKDAAVDAFIAAEIRRISETYGNHPSFVFFCIGNELGMDSDWDTLEQLLADAKRRDPRRLYNATTARQRVASDDYWVTHRTAKAAARGIGPAHTDWDFEQAVESSPVPVIAHETGQRPVFPDFPALIPKFDGPLKPDNLERLQRKLADSGLAGQLDDFRRASASFQALLYQAEHEAMQRTPGFGGYQLLMLSDFTGQSQAHVGFLDPFFESKGVFGAQELRRWNAPTVPLARFERFTWSAQESFRAELEVAHYGPEALASASAEWSLRTASGELLGQGWLLPQQIPSGGVSPLGVIEVPLSGLAAAAQLELRVTVAGFHNRWRLLAAPAGIHPVEDDPALLVTEFYDASARRVLAEGGRVLLLAHRHRDEDTRTSRFEPVYWSGGWWGDRFSHLGGFCDPAHPAFAGFPTSGSTDWSWQELMADGALFDLRWTPAELRPLVQAVPDFHHDARLGWVWEAAAGPGRLLVSGFDLVSDLDRRHAARALRNSLLAYVQSEAFQPAVALAPSLLEGRLAPSFMQELGAQVLSASAEEKGFEAIHLLDGDSNTIWHTPWTGAPPVFPHVVVIDLGRVVAIGGFRFQQRKDGARGGKLHRLEVEFAIEADLWSLPVTRFELSEDAGVQERLLVAPVSARYLRLTALASHEGRSWVSLGEWEVLPED